MNTQSNKHWLTWPVFYTLSEVYQVPLNIIWFIFSAAIAYQYFHIVNVINVVLCCIDVMLFDLAVNVADNYFDYRHGKDPHFLKVTNPVGRLNLPVEKVRNLVIIMYVVSALPGLILVYRTGWQILLLGTIGYIVGIFYTAGKFPLNATPFCEAIVSLFIAFFIVLAGVLVSIYGAAQLTWSIIGRIFLLCMPLILVMYAMQLANNACDLKEDLINGRHTLASFIGQQMAFKVVKALMIVGFLMPLVLAVMRIIKWPVGLTTLLLVVFWPKMKQFFIKPDKNTTYLLLLKEISLFLIAYIALFTIFAI